MAIKPAKIPVRARSEALHDGGDYDREAGLNPSKESFD
jgi:hypothetical protein